MKKGLIRALGKLAWDVVSQAAPAKGRKADAGTRKTREAGARQPVHPVRVQVGPVAGVVSPGAPGAQAGTETIEVDPTTVRDLVLSYGPDSDGAPDGGEIIWTWVPYAEKDGRGKDRPVLVLARGAADRVYVVKLTSRSHDGDREFLAIGAGEWDARGRESWVDLDQLYSVHVRGMRREAAALDRDRFALIARVLRERYGWQDES